VSNASINVYGNVFAVYGLSAYAQATGNQEALQLAKQTFRTLDKLFHNTATDTGGYDETTADFSLDGLQLLGCWNSSAAFDSVISTSVGSTAGNTSVGTSVASSRGPTSGGSNAARDNSSGGSSTPSNSTACRPRLSQSLNTVLHMTEALTELSKVSKGSDTAVTDRLWS
jgi:hypothetical protein